MNSLKEIYVSAFRILDRYWTVYGGRPALIRSPFMHLALALMIPTYGLWTKSGWWELVITVIPNVLGFSLGGYAILLAFGDEQFKSVISGKDSNETEEYSPFMSINATFFHFILVQCIALSLAIIAKAHVYQLVSVTIKKSVVNTVPITYDFGVWLKQVCWFLGFLIFIYAMTTAVAVTMSIFEISDWYDEYQYRKKKQKKKKRRSKKTGK